MAHNTKHKNIRKIETMPVNDNQYASIEDLAKDHKQYLNGLFDTS